MTVYIRYILVYICDSIYSLCEYTVCRLHIQLLNCNYKLYTAVSFVVMLMHCNKDSNYLLENILIINFVRMDISKNLSNNRLPLR